MLSSNLLFLQLRIDWPKNDYKNFPMKIHFSIPLHNIFSRNVKNSFHSLFNASTRYFHDSLYAYCVILPKSCYNQHLLPVWWGKEPFFYDSRLWNNAKGSRLGEKVCGTRKISTAQKLQNDTIMWGMERDMPNVWERKSIKSLWIIQWTFFPLTEYSWKLRIIFIFVLYKGESVVDREICKIA